MSARTHLWSRPLALVATIAGIVMLAVSLTPSGTGEPAYVVERHVLSIAGEYADEYEEPGVTAAYLVNKNNWTLNDVPVQVAFNATDSPVQHDPETLVRNAMERWSGVSGSYFRFEWAGTTDVGASTCGNPFKVDGVNSVTFVTTMSPVTLGITCTVWRPNAGPNAPLVEFDMQLNANINWGSGAIIHPGEYDLASTILHEFGHAAGLGHPCNSSGSGTCTAAEEASVMYPSLTSQVQKRNLRQDDIDAMLEAYPQSAATPTPSPTAAPTTAPTAPPTVPQGTNLQFNIKAPGVARD